MSTAFSLSILDLVPVGANGSAAESVRQALELAQLAERLGYVRYWFAEHHGMPAVASTAPEVLIAHIAAHTRKLKLGSGGIMLPNHSPLRVAEAFRTLEALHPGRIDLGLGRAPGSDARASQALRALDGGEFPALLNELLIWSGRRELPPSHALHSLRAMPDDAALPPLWMLGSSGASARLAGQMGMGYSFASHFSPTPAAPAFEAYRRAFEPSDDFPEPHAILGLTAICAPTEEEARYLASSMELAWARIRQGRFERLPTPEQALSHEYTDVERRLVQDFRELAIIGSPDAVRSAIEAKAAACQADEVMVVSNLPDAAARQRGYALIASAA